MPKAGATLVEHLHRVLDHIVQRRPPKLVIVTAYDSSYSEIARLTIPRMEQYAHRHQYEFRVVPDVDCERHPAWIKIPVIRNLLEEAFDFVFWLDADALIVRQDRSILSAVAPGADLQMSWLGPETTDWQAPPGLVGHFNDGVMLIRVNDWSRQFFAKVWDVGNVPLHWRDQGAILHLLGYDNLIDMGSENPTSPYRCHVAPLDLVWNSVPGVAMAVDPIIHHYAGIGDRTLKLDFMSSDLKVAKNGDEVSGAARRAWSRELSLRVKQARDSHGQ